ncbi:MAG: AraC family transcriptional regulator [Bacteroidota bacterium]|nr:AraC family transcriptional regulator [Bacteroidota bacterium]
MSQLKKQSTLENRLVIIQDLLANLFHNKKEEFDFEIIKAIKYILGKSGQISIAKLSTEFHLTERTFERRFIKSIGVSAKQFAKIIQFNQSLQQITLKDYHKLSDVVFTNGYADQSHFIKVFKAYTGKTPKAFKARI